MSGNKEKSFPPPVPKRKPQGFKPKSGEVPGIQRLYGSNHSSEAPPTIDQTTVKSPLSGLLNPLHGGRPQQSNLASTPPSYPIAQVLTTILAANRGSNIEPDTRTHRFASQQAFVLLFVIESGRAYTDADFQKISNLLKAIGRDPWSKVPRIYTVLRIVGQLQIIDAFIDQGITDIWFPFSTSSLPNALGSALHPQFLDIQKQVLTKGLDLEKDEGRKHASFGRDESLPFKVEKELGGGRYSQVHKITSIISKREFARKQLRRGAGLRNAAEIKSFKVELQVLKKIHHHHCVELIASYTDPKWFALIMSPVADCDLKTFYSLCKGDEERMDTLRTFYGCLVTALEYLHASKIRHRDIKPQNILVKGVTVYLADFGISLDWEGLSRSTTTEDSAKTVLYFAPEVAEHRPRNTASDIWSLGCVFLEIATVLAGFEVEEMQNFFRTTNSDYRFYTNVEIIPNWSTFIALKLPPGDDVSLEWVSEMLLPDPSERPSATSLVSSIAQNARANHILTTRFCGSCCEVDISSEGSGSDGELWADIHETVKPHKNAGFDSLSELLRQQRLSSPPARSPPPLPNSQAVIIEDLPARRDSPSVDMSRYGADRRPISFLRSVGRKLLSSGNSENRPRSERQQRADESDAEYKLAVEAGRYQEAQDQAKRTGRHEEADNDDLANALKLSREEEQLRRRELSTQNAQTLFDNDSIQIAPYVGFSKGYQRQPPIDWAANPTYENAPQQRYDTDSISASAASRSSPGSAQLLFGIGESPITTADKVKYDSIFESLDRRHDGIVMSDECVPFFLESKLPEQILAKIWDLASFRKENSLNRDEFAIAMYFIRQQRNVHSGLAASPPLPLILPRNLLPAKAQDNIKRDSLNHATLPSPGFGGFSAVENEPGLVPPATPFKNNQITGDTKRLPELTPEEKGSFGDLFRQADFDGTGVVPGEAAVKFFQNTGIETRILGEMWHIADKDNRGFLTPAGFAIVLRLIGHYQAGRQPSPELAHTPLDTAYSLFQQLDTKSPSLNATGKPDGPGGYGEILFGRA